MKLGDPVDPTHEQVLGDRGLVRIRNEYVVIGRNVAKSSLRVGEPQGDDLRTLPVLYAPTTGAQSRDFRTAKSLLTETDFDDWLVTCPRTRWLMEEMSRLDP